MTLQERLMNDFKEAMKARDDVRKNTLSFARAAIKQVEVDTRKELTDDDIIPILAKQVKMRKDALAEFEKAGRTDLSDSYKAEIAVLAEYLPKQLTTEEIENIVVATAKEMGISGGRQNMGKLMGAVMPKVKGLADGNTVKWIIEKFLT